MCKHAYPVNGFVTIVIDWSPVFYIHSPRQAFCLAWLFCLVSNRIDVSAYIARTYGNSRLRFDVNPYGITTYVNLKIPVEYVKNDVAFVDICNIL